MALPYDPFILVVLNMMKRFGGNQQLVVTTAGVYDPATSKVANSAVTYTVRAMKFDYILKKEGETTMANTLIRSGDKQLFIQPDVAVPVPNAKTDVIIFNGVKHSIVTVKEVNPSGTQSVLLELFIRE